jgi:murein DD-endopeptidase MepM/ murein hydrolase activator NlpD
MFETWVKLVRLGVLCLLGALLISACQTAAVPQGAEEIVYPDGAPRIISDFKSMRGVNGGLRNASHQGIDITGPVGQPILAIADGTVLDAEVGRCWGPTLTVDHGTGPDGRPLIALYGHLGEMLVEPGDTVTRGQLIARLGDNQDRYRCIWGVRHLHLQLGRDYREGPKGTWWGHVRWLEDGARGVNPHQYWADGPGRITCFREGAVYPEGTITYPVPCAPPAPATS